MMERGIQIKGAEDPDPRAFDTEAVLVSQEEIEEQFAQVNNKKSVAGRPAPPERTGVILLAHEDELLGPVSTVFAV